MECGTLETSCHPDVLTVTKRFPQATTHVPIAHHRVTAFCYLEINSADRLS